MNEMSKTSDGDKKVAGKSKGGEAEDGDEGEKERNLAKAALSIAELSTFLYCASISLLKLIQTSFTS